MTAQHSAISRKFDRSDGFLPYIDEIRFPLYKSLEEDLTVRLNWPIIALVGPNGTNKSSVLQAISAAPEGRSLASYWFSTAVDDIDRSALRSGQHRFIYRYRFDRSGVTAECRKSRVTRRYRSSSLPKPLQGKHDPDYWEPTKPTARDSMADIPESDFDEHLSKSRDRWNPIVKPVLYLDFRSELSAFDKYIHHESFNRWTPDSTTKRHRAVLRSKPIARALAGKRLSARDQQNLIRPVRDLDPNAVASIANILGKPIERIALVEHRFFGPDGFTVRLYLSGSGASYSEAHAGSGEYAVVRLVDAISSAKPRSLVLLDEPEVSLHPGAQTELMRFIERAVLTGGHQVVISTHSPVLAAALPDQAIKVLGFDTSHERVVLVADGCSPTEAFAHLGQVTSGSGRPRLIVEDELAAEFVRAALRRHAPTKLDTLDIVPFPGGAAGIVQNVLSAFAIAGETKTGILLDGDQRTTAREPGSDLGLRVKAADGIDALRKIWRHQMHDTIPHLHSNSDHALDEHTLRSCLNWAQKHLGFLPGESPEKALAAAVHPGRPEPTTGWKRFWIDEARAARHFTPSEIVSSDVVLEFQRTALSDLEANCALLTETFEAVTSIIDW